jgi:hypothetical protein
MEESMQQVWNLVLCKIHHSGLPTLLQSSDPRTLKKAYLLKTTFINKNSETLRQDLQSLSTITWALGILSIRMKKGGAISLLPGQ